MTSGSLGEGNGRRSMITHDSASPTTSMPSQNVAVAKSTALRRRAKPVEQVRARQLALQAHREREPLAHERVHLAQPRVRREEHERAAAACGRDTPRPAARRGAANSGDFGIQPRAVRRRAAPDWRSRTATARSTLARRRCPASGEGTRTIRGAIVALVSTTLCVRAKSVARRNSATSYGAQFTL